MKRSVDDGSLTSWWRRWFALFSASAGALPLGRNTPPTLNDTPGGLVYLYSEPSPEEAELTRQILRNQGFHIEYVPQMWTGIYGQGGSPDIYVRPDEVQPVLRFLKELRFAGENDGSEEKP